ncbi:MULTISPECIES: type II toxin-antitoxin system RelB/DinJ family antitoxin [Collinsella]|jgi:antitoxin component of RelBE/YafQ-DinJ toxin-antitoxin module|uniref:type II toxin-antitoxin system RelB/DinJ family antitoxin n=1 Tax=Collinsella TaxID=102106 RepID=UPI000E5203A8|nr:MULTISPECIES: type II toxin-antitoxin system RelB/DinJ family antitoxin [unclassified Collinsella]RGW69552.1 hypothetical protein DWV58_06585 [Collinsella sp. AF11-11]RHA68214.1 hypothetical protein DW925_07090 [Collinsella sp. AM43-1]RHN36771.1 hypothetical protein DWZ15_07055 [Collinsella sp. AF29-7AC]
MATATVQLNTRIDPMLKAGGDAVLTRNGLGPSDAIRALWTYLVEHQTLPGFMVEDRCEAPRAESLAEQGCGLAFFSLGLSAADFAPAESSADNWGAVRDDMYDAMIAGIEANCR